MQTGFVVGRHRDGSLRIASGLVPGLILVAVGALFFLNNLHLFYIRDWFRFWPAILIALGIVKLVDSTFSGGKVAGGVLAGFGAIFLARNLGFIDISMREIWPLFLIGLGLLMLVQRTGNWHVKATFPPVSQTVRADTAGAETIKVEAIFGGTKRIVASQNFQGGEAIAIFGGVELDLRQAGMEGDSAILEIDAIFGGVELKIPQNWNAEVQGVGIFGGYADNTLHSAVPVPGMKKLIVKGAAAFGGVEVKN